MRKERKKIDQLNPSRYILVTSVSILPRQKRRLSEAIGPSLRKTSDIIGCDDLNLLLQRHPEIEKSHFKLWLSSSGVLERILHSDIYAYQRIFRADIDQTIRVFVENESLTRGHRLLEDNHVIVISGPPGIGKTTLGEMLAYLYLSRDWTVVAIRNLNDAFKMFDQSCRQVFVFDDFLGQTALDRNALSSNDALLRRFIKLVQRRESNLRFILTTRTYLLEEARSISEHIADDHIDLSKFHLDVGVYTRRIRAHILYNHLYANRIPPAFINALIVRKAVTKIIDHPNYTPRIIEWMTASIISKHSTPTSYPTDFLTTLDNPSKMWETAFCFHIPFMCQNLLYSLFLLSNESVEIEDLRSSFDRLHAVLSTKHNQPTTSMDFPNALRILEGSFVLIRESRISFINPSVRDFLSRYLIDIALLSDLTHESIIPTTRWAVSLYDQFKKSGDLSNKDRARYLARLIPFSLTIKEIPIQGSMDTDYDFLNQLDLDHIERISVLLSWWIDSEISEFLTVAVSIASSCREGCSFFLHAERMMDLLDSLEELCFENDDPDLVELKQTMENLLIQIIEEDCSMPDDLELCCSLVDRCSQHTETAIWNSLEYAVQTIVDDIGSDLRHFSYRELEEYLPSIESLHHSLFLIGGEIVISDIILILEDSKSTRSEVKSSVEIRKTISRKSQISDREIASLFLTLVEGR